MTQRLWTSKEVQAAIRYVGQGMTHAAIGVVLNRSGKAVAQQMARVGARSTRYRERLSDEDVLALAKAALVREIDAARAERHRVPLYRHWPAGLWP